MFENGHYDYSSVERWSMRVKGRNVFKLARMVVPVNIGNTHWCLAVAHIQERVRSSFHPRDLAQVPFVAISKDLYLAACRRSRQRIQYYDSMGGLGLRFLGGLKSYFKDEVWDAPLTPILAKFMLLSVSRAMPC